jgi:serine/threonine protein kinase
MSEGETIGPFILGKTLGEGTTGKVKLAQNKNTYFSILNIRGKKVAIKIIKKSLLSEKESLKRKVEKEIEVMKLIKHPHVVELYDVLQTSKNVYLIIEYVESGELFDYIVQRGEISILDAFKIFKQIVEGLQYCHSKLIW